MHPPVKHFTVAGAAGGDIGSMDGRTPKSQPLEARGSRGHARRSSEMSEQATLTTTSSHRIQILAEGPRFTAWVSGKPLAADGVYDLIGGGRIQVTGGRIVQAAGAELPETRPLRPRFSSAPSS